MKKYFLLLSFLAIFTSGCGVKDTFPLREQATQQKPQLIAELQPFSNSEPTFIPQFKLYSNSAYNFVFLYPKNSFVKENGNEIFITNEDEKNTFVAPSTAPTSSYMKITIHDKDATLAFMNGRDMTSLWQAEQENKIREVTLQKNHARFETTDPSLNTYGVHHYFLRNDGVVVETQYRNYSGQSQSTIEEGLSYFSFVDDWISYKNDTYKFSFKYPIGWNIEMRDDIFSIENLDFPFQFSLSKEEKEIRETEYSNPYIRIGVSPKNFKNTVHSIESSSVSINGISESAIGDIKNIEVNNFSGKTGSQGDAIGIGSRIYYFPLSKWNTGLWIDYNERPDGKEKLIEKIISSFRKE